MRTKAELSRTIEEKEAQLRRAQEESEAWNGGKYKASANAQISKVFVESLRKEITKLRAELESL